MKSDIQVEGHHASLFLCPGTDEYTLTKCTTCIIAKMRVRFRLVIK